MKKILCLILAAVLLLSLCACGAAPAAQSENLQIVVTVFPEYDWVKSVLGEQSEHAEVTMLLDNGVDLHNYQPTAADILKIATCDLFIYVGGESDGWVDAALQKATNPDMVVINLMETLGERVKEEELVEGMQAEAEEEEEEAEYDEHVWLSLQNAAALVGAISEAVQTLDEAHAEEYKANAAAYIEKLDSLDAEYQTAVDGAACRTLLFGDRFPFRYLTDDYGLSYYAAFVGCSAETEASFETVTFLANKVDELSLPAILTIEGADHRIAETILDNTQSKTAKILSLNSMQAVTAKDVEQGASYLSIMENNLSVLQEALG